MSKSLLIVDDSSEIRKVIRRWSERYAGVEDCAEAEDGLDALEKAQEREPDLIIMDLSMPRMNGLDSARVLRFMLPATPIVLLTIYADAVDLSHAQALGISAIFSKADMQALVEHVKQVFAAA